MDIEKIKEAAMKFLGAHDFRNFCKRERFICAKDENKK
jgi:tRNA U38,U39,U40 pseudouridine synthase TruA